MMPGAMPIGRGPPGQPPRSGGPGGMRSSMGRGDYGKFFSSSPYLNI